MLMTNRKRPNNIVKQPYSGYTLPKSSEKGESFIDFNEVKKHIERKPVKKIRRKRGTDR